MGEECLAIMNSIRQFQVYIAGVTIEIQTDHGYVIYLEIFKDEDNISFP